MRAVVAHASVLDLRTHTASASRAHERKSLTLLHAVVIGRLPYVSLLQRSRSADRLARFLCHGFFFVVFPPRALRAVRVYPHRDGAGAPCYGANKGVLAAGGLHGRAHSSLLQCDGETLTEGVSTHRSRQKVGERFGGSRAIPGRRTQPPSNCSSSRIHMSVCIFCCGVFASALTQILHLSSILSK
jgi:hypothetical protein